MDEPKRVTAEIVKAYREQGVSVLDDPLDSLAKMREHLRGTGVVNRARYSGKLMRHMSKKDLIMLVLVLSKANDNG